MSNLSETAKRINDALKVRTANGCIPAVTSPEQKAASDKRRADEKEAKLNAILDGICSRLNELEGKKAASDADDTFGNIPDEAEREAMAEKGPKTLTEQEIENEQKHVKEKAMSDEIADPKAGYSGGEKFGDVQARADAAFRAHNMKAEPPMAGETLSAYRRRVIKPLQKFSEAWKNVQTRTLADDVFGICEAAVIADSIEAARSPIVPDGVLIERRERDASGREIVTFHGRPMSWMRQFTRPAMVAKFRDPRLLR